MQKLNEIISKGRQGVEIDLELLTEYLGQYEIIILRGAGAFGSELGKNLRSLDALKGKLLYWDIRADELKSLHGISVEKPYENKYPPASTLLINCIPNGSTAGNVILSEIQTNGYSRIISGMGLFEAAFCPMTIRTGFRSDICINTTACNWCSCDLMMNLLRSGESTSNGRLFNDALSFQVITFVITLKCTLECKHCGQYIPYFKSDMKRHIPAEQVKQDIDLFFSSMDTAGFVSIIGGEPFTHPQLPEIIDKILEKKNFGVLGITTNGVCKIQDEVLAKLRNDRIRVIFSDYSRSLESKQKKLFNENVEKIRKAGIKHTIGEPLWVTPTDLKRRAMPRQEKEALKSGCVAFLTCQTVQDGKFFPCSTTTYVHDHQIGGYPDDYALLDATKSPRELRSAVLAVNQQTSYLSCEHCTGCGDMLPAPGEQGTDERYMHLLRRHK